MLKVAIENSYIDTYKGKDEFGNKLFMQELFKNHNIELVRVSVNKLTTSNTFSEYNVFTPDWLTKTIQKEYTPDILWSRRSLWTYYKYLLLEKSYTITPSKKISIMSGDKYETYLFCKSHQPKTFLLSTFLNKKKNQQSLEKVVIKPIRANWWKGIELMTIKDLYTNRNRFNWLEELYIVQDLKDFSWWYPWIVEWIHDIRLMFAWDSIIEATLRTPRSWSFKSNIWDWWIQKALAVDLLPITLINLSKTIYQELDLQWDDIMSMDFAFSRKEDRRYLIEINASPWTRYYQTDKWEVTKICKWLITFFKSLH